VASSGEETTALAISPGDLELEREADELVLEPERPHSVDAGETSNTPSVKSRSRGKLLVVTLRYIKSGTLSLDASGGGGNGDDGWRGGGTTTTAVLEKGCGADGTASIQM